MASTDSKELGVEMHAIDTEQGDNPDMTGTHISAQSMGTPYDQRDMRVMGKLQELRVRYIFNRLCAITDKSSETSASSLFWDLLAH
jgi:hypothetical protein